MEKIDKDKYKDAVSYLLQLVSSKRLGIHFEVDKIPEKTEEVINMVKDDSGLELSRLNKNDYIKYELALTDTLSKVLSNPLQRNIEDELFLINKSVNVQLPIPQCNVTIDEPLKKRLKRLGLTMAGISFYYLNPDYVSLVQLKNVEYLIETKKIKVGLSKDFKILISLVQIIRSFGNIKSYKVADSYLLHFDKMESLYSSPVRLFLHLLNMYGVFMEFNGIKKKFFINVEEKNIPDSAIFKIVTPGKGRTLKIEGNPIFEGKKQVGIWIPFAYLYDMELYMKDYMSHKI
jgi:hypothetical protein